MKDLKPLMGREKIKEKDCTVGEISDFWKWSYSFISSPTVRGDFAEYLVYVALKGNNVSDEHYQTRMDWDMVDLTYGRGIDPPLPFITFCESTGHGWGIEVKSSSTTNKSGVRFDIKPKKGFHVKLNKIVEHHRNWADIHIFALLTNEESQVAGLDLSNWDFYVIPTAKLELFRKVKKREFKSISVSGLLDAGAISCRFGTLKKTVDRTIKSEYDLLKGWKIDHDRLKQVHIKQ